MSHYFISLTPQAPFFFGSEKTFGDGQNQNYFAKSNPFPQQTTILGMLRKELLIQGNLYKEKWSDYSKEDYSNMNALIGEAFKLNRTNNFGKINTISPVFISNGNACYIQTPFDDGLTIEFKKGRSSLDSILGNIPIISNYTAKTGLPDSFTSTKSEMASFNEIFTKFVKVGNAKDKTEDENDKFFKQLFYTMNKNYSFAFFADIDFDLKPSIVFMGADNSSFRMNVEKTTETFESLFIPKSSKDRIALLSDAWVDESIYEKCIFAITEIVDFRTTDIKNWSIRKSNKFEMIKRGSVFFVDEINKSHIQKLLQNKSLQKIGYNIYN
ncbi:hypothetical protein GF406_05250 [candidate division KSB1 bacterium]|nr:hypothetical protein [candidate division KSB1 bacterium]